MGKSFKVGVQGETMSKDKKSTKKRNGETVDNWREYLNEEFETIELTIKTAKDFRFILERVIKHLGKDFPDNLYKDGLITIIKWIDVSIDLHYSQQEFLLKSDK